MTNDDENNTVTQPTQEAWRDQLQQVEATLDRVGRALNVSYMHAVDRPTLNEVRNALRDLRETLEYDAASIDDVITTLQDRVQRVEHERDLLRSGIMKVLLSIHADEVTPNDISDQ